MGLFSRKPRAPQPQMQVPDELAQEAALQYGSQNFAGALETYGSAIDKIHTMCVVAARQSRIRTPGEQDQRILDGFNNALGAALAMNRDLDVRSTVEQALNYLAQIADEAGAEAGRYVEAAKKIEMTYRLGKG